MKVTKEFIKPRLCDLCGHEGCWYIKVYKLRYIYLALCDDCIKELCRKLEKKDRNEGEQCTGYINDIST